MTSLIFPKCVEYTVFCLRVSFLSFFFFNFSRSYIVVLAYFRTVQAHVELESVNIIKVMVVLRCD